ncbi:hypothetical protein [Sphingomonas sp. 28-63-12]|uniref:hypothetical protein n=1 Tax=Sphingomonas sp. 28-63-12 TaxID=1970434 RepID=UPI0035A98965
MMIRMILALLIAAFALPGSAPACHAPAAVPMTMAMQSSDHHSSRHHQTPMAPMSEGHCIGCIPPTSWQSAAVLPDRIVARLPRAIAGVPLAIGIGTPPDLPPPRLG